MCVCVCVCVCVRFYFHSSSFSFFLFFSFVLYIVSSLGATYVSYLATRASGLALPGFLVALLRPPNVRPASLFARVLNPLMYTSQAPRRRKVTVVDEADLPPERPTSVQKRGVVRAEACVCCCGLCGTREGTKERPQGYNF